MLNPSLRHFCNINYFSSNLLGSDLSGVRESINAFRIINKIILLITAIILIVTCSIIIYIDLKCVGMFFFV